MGEGICYIVGAGDYHGPLPAPAREDFVIAVDGGFAHLRGQSLRANLVIGDFDSLKEPVSALNTEVIALSREKDDTDMLAALRAGLLRGYRSFHIYGGTGGRLDHTLANIQCLAYLGQEGAQGFLFDRDTVLTVLSNSRLVFPAKARGLLSVFALTDTASGVCASGLKYPLREATLRSTYPMGVSNEFIGQPAELSVRDGTLLILYPRGLSPVFQAGPEG